MSLAAPLSPAGRALLERIDRYLNAVPRLTRDAYPIGPFTLFASRDSDFPYFTYARPTGPIAGDLAAAIARVREQCAALSRTPRWEFIAALAPTLPAALEAAGFPEPERQPLMVVTPATFRPECGPGIAVRSVTGGDEALAFIRAQGEAWGMDAGSPADVEKMLAGGCVARVALSEGVPGAAGVHTPVGDTTELAGIGTVPGLRRRGLGGAVSSALTADAFERGCTCVFLSAGDERARRLYARLGFQEVGTGMTTMDGEDPLRQGDAA